MSDFLDKYRVMRRLVLLWAVGIISLTMAHYFPRIGQVQTPDAVIITGIIGILSVVIGFQGKPER